jgi:hypothetical protein
MLAAGRGEIQAALEPMRRESSSRKFETGEIVITPAASAALEASGQTLDALLARHQAGDWGEVADHVRMINDRGLEESFNLQSIYTVQSNQRLVLVTNRERTLTMVHLDQCASSPVV